jgi:hypothetical protein
MRTNCATWHKNIKKHQDRSTRVQASQKAGERDY